MKPFFRKKRIPKLNTIQLRIKKYNELHNGICEEIFRENDDERILELNKKRKEFSNKIIKLQNEKKKIFSLF